MDDVVFEASCNTIIEITYLSRAGFLTRGLFSNNPAYIPRGLERSKNELALDCYELYRKRLVQVTNETEIYSVSLEHPQKVRGSQLIYGECQPSKQWVREELEKFTTHTFPMEKELRYIPDEDKITALEFFSGRMIDKKMGKLNHLIDDLICSQIFEKVPKKKLINQFTVLDGDPESPAHALSYAHSQWTRLVGLFAQLSIVAIRQDKRKSPKEKRSLINRAKAISGPGDLGSVEEIIQYWPVALGKKPGVIFS